jgi:predicted phosphodiesterase
MKDKDKLDALLEIGTNGPAVEVKRQRAQHPSGWQPSLEFDGVEGVATLPPSDGVPNFDDFLIEQGFDPAEFEVVGNPRTSRWQRYDGEWLCSYRFSFRRRDTQDAQDIEDVLKAAKGAKVKKPASALQERVYGVQITDLQSGQGDGYGAEGMAVKALQIIDIVKDDLAALKKSGRPASQIFIPITGDLVEGILGWYEMQTFSVSLDRREQVKLVRRLLTEVLIGVATEGLPVHVAVVPGNHGENRHNGKAFTTLGDNDDVAIIEQIAEAFKLTGTLEHVTFSFPDKERLSLTVEVLGWIVGLTHGHVAKAGAGVEGKILNWFKSMAATRDPIGDSDVLFTGHYHHPRFQSLIGDTYWIQGGALCDTSAWFSQSYGLVSDPCLMRFTMTRENRVESVMPYFWPRTQTNSKTLGQ